MPTSSIDAPTQSQVRLTIFPSALRWPQWQPRCRLTSANSLTILYSSSTHAITAPPKSLQAKKARLSTASLASIAPTTDIKTTQLYVLSSRKHRDAIKHALQRAKSERDRANTSFLQAQQWLKDANDTISKLQEELKEAQEEYSEAKGLSAVQLADVNIDESEDEDEQPKKRKRGSGGDGKYKKAPLITDMLMDMAKSGQLVDGKKLHEVDCDVGSRDQAKFVNAMCLVEELWTEEEVSLSCVFIACLVYKYHEY